MQVEHIAVKFDKAAKMTFDQLTRNKFRIFLGILRGRKITSVNT